MHVASGHSNDSTQLENLLTNGPNEGIPPIYKNQKIKKKNHSTKGNQDGK